MFSRNILPTGCWVNVNNFINHNCFLMKHQGMINYTHFNTVISQKHYMWLCICFYRFSLLFPSLFRLLSSWIPNFSRWLIWYEQTGPIGRTWTRRDKVARVFPPMPAPTMTMLRKPKSAQRTKPAARPAAAATLKAHHPIRPVSFCWRAETSLAFFILQNAACSRGSACRGSWALLLFAFATRDEL